MKMEEEEEREEMKGITFDLKEYRAVGIEKIL
jgi:hypothetical protein